MTEFNRDWLALRAPADTAARDLALLAPLEAWRAARSGEEPLAVLDLGCGTGANLRWLAPRLAAQAGGRLDQTWHCVDNDPALLRALDDECPAWAQSLDQATRPQPGGGLSLSGPLGDWTVRTECADLAAARDRLPIPAHGLVAATALLDLVSEAWLDALVSACARAGATLLATLTYDGRVTLKPPAAHDGLVIALVNGHQRRDKGFGPALGPSASRRLRTLGEASGFAVRSADSDWRLECAPGSAPPESGDDLRRLQQALLDGWRDAALEQAADPTTGAAPEQVRAAITGWHTERCAAVAAGHSQIRVGHQDQLLLPPQPG